METLQIGATQLEWIVIF